MKNHVEIFSNVVKIKAEMGIEAWEKPSDGWAFLQEEDCYTILFRATNILLCDYLILSSFACAEVIESNTESGAGAPGMLRFVAQDRMETASNTSCSNSGEQD